ncbi:hypothetical protein BGY98DRAFT_980263 [Russula aff. rugulosa BPL654]|nr:hypothetical protein BGY98DRAFT_980263 [Russula aff. rugulosa BPL654]
MRGPSHSTQDNQMEEDSIPQLHVPKLKAEYVIVTSSPGDILGRPETDSCDSCIILTRPV